jgi:hypothetical protein
MTETIKYRAVGTWSLHSDKAYANPFLDVAVDATFYSPSGRVFTMPGFYDGEQTWRVRFSPDEPGPWTYHIIARPTNPELFQEGRFNVTPRETEGFLKATPGQAWGFQYESGAPAFLLGDTVYNLFGMAHCGGDVDAFMQRRADQGFNVLRVRVPVSPFHGPNAPNVWQTRSTWPWGGSAQAPQFDRFNLYYFQTVDQVVRRAAELGIGLEIIMEAWGFEFPFSNRAVFVPEWEALWLRYLIARYDAFSSVYFWTLMNEYEYYPDGHWQYNPVADLWAMRMGRWVKALAPHGHVIAVHNGPQLPPFVQRFAVDPGAVDAIMFQVWGTTGEDDGWLAAGIEEHIGQSLTDWPGSAVFAEYGYERNPDVPLSFPGFKYCDAEHTRRGAWRGAFCGLGVINGFENTWGPLMMLDQDLPGVAYLQNVRRFFTEVVPFHRLHPAPEVLGPGEHTPGHQPLALATDTQDIVTVYMPTGGSVALKLAAEAHRNARWYDPRTGEETPAQAVNSEGRLSFTVPKRQTSNSHPDDWVLVLTQG